jgi:hypothetical protein
MINTHLGPRSALTTEETSIGSGMDGPEVLRFTGAVWVTLTLHAKRFFANSAVFRKQRGSDAFYSSLNELSRLHRQVCNSKTKAHSLRFQIESRSAELTALGYRAGVFNQFPIATEFAPVFSHRSRADLSGQEDLSSVALSPVDFLDVATRAEVMAAIRRAQSGLPSQFKSQGEPDKVLELTLAKSLESANRKLLDDWKRWTKWLVLTRYGYFQVWLRYKFESKTAAEVLEDTLRLQTDCNLYESVKTKIHECRKIKPDYQLGPGDAIDLASRGDLGAWEALRGLAEELPPDEADSLKTAPFLVAVESVLQKKQPMWETYLQWEIARLLVKDLSRDVEEISQCGLPGSKKGIPKLVPPGRVNQAWYHDQDDPGVVDLPLRWRHTGIHISHIAKETNGKDGPRKVEAIDFTSARQRQVACLFEGVPVRELATDRQLGGQGESVTVIPPLRPALLDEVIQHNAASWTGELLLLTGDSALLCSLQRNYVLVFDAQVGYLDYWKTILRGIAHLCEMHLLARQLRFDTAKILARHLEVKSPQEALIAESRTASILLARARTASNASVIARGDYARDKFELTAKAFLINENLESAQRNLELVNAAIEQEESYAVQRTELSLNRIVAIYALAATVLALPPFWDAATNIASALKDWNKRKSIEAPDLYLQHQTFLDRSVGIVVVFLVMITVFALVNAYSLPLRRRIRGVLEWAKRRLRSWRRTRALRS